MPRCCSHGVPDDAVRVHPLSTFSIRPARALRTLHASRALGGGGWQLAAYGVSFATKPSEPPGLFSTPPPKFSD
jgi:hypothetical protein